ncbi:hypothetical protein NVP1165O_26 [Vibrio phage 1.165.O._10N.261.51.B7]|nr:hypothetical protein NVP1165O_26 [Vibrio phage 1.165.O._10N.261.51.B7]
MNIDDLELKVTKEAPESDLFTAVKVINQCARPSIVSRENNEHYYSEGVVHGTFTKKELEDAFDYFLDV